ncbi:MAG: nuclear transport factor 2 family protein [Novosphingobium sp.]|nr:nuclear transport factor 2 family protein [Novosphingobium sp.]
MDPRIQELLDEREIRRLLAEYAHGCDRCDEALMASVYAEDSWDDHGLNKATGPEFARIMTQEIIPATCETLSHLLGQSLIELDGDAARAETYYLAVTLSTVDGVPMCNQLGGRYVDRLERVGGRWEVKHRVCMRDWSVSLEVKADSFANSQLTLGRRDAEDAGVKTMRLAHRG